MRADSGMEEPAINENFVRRYLLGLLPEDERERLEIRILTDDRIYETLATLEDEVEDELIDQYLDDELTEPESEKFERIFLKTPERAQKFKLIKDLKDHVVVPAHAETSVPPLPTYTRSKWIPAIGVFQNPLFGLATAAALTLVMLCCIWLWMRVNSLDAQLRQAQAEHATDNILKEQVEQLRRRNEELTANLQRSEDQRTTLEQDLASLKSGDGSPNKLSPSELTFASVVLSPNLRSTDQTVKTLSLPPSVTRARLILNVEQINPKDYKSLRAVVKKQAGPEIWRSNVNLQLRGNNAREILTIPAERLMEGRYTVELEGITTDGQTELVGLYLFQVVHSKSERAP